MVNKKMKYFDLLKLSNLVDINVIVSNEKVFVIFKDIEIKIFDNLIS